ncbi:MAG: threonine dehydratase [Xanthobacteraceae bacterium]
MAGAKSVSFHEERIMSLFSKADLTDAVAIVQQRVAPTPAYPWPLLEARTGVRVFVKHENHTPIGAFKIRGGLVYLESLRRAGSIPPGLVTATRGNHGQSVALAASLNGIPAAIVVPEGNSQEKNAAMRAFGAELIVAGRDFDDSRAVAAQIAEQRGYHFVPAFHPDLVKGVSTYAYELLTSVAKLAAVYVPIGMGSGICGLITVRDLLGLDTEIVGVVAENAPAYALSFATGEAVFTESAKTFADGMACREPQAAPLALICQGAARILQLHEGEIAEAVRVYFTDTHNVAEGAGSAALAGLMRERKRYAGKRVAVVLSGGNIDASVFAETLAGRTPRA